MKKIALYTMMLGGLLFTACEPLEDIHKEVDGQIEDALIDQKAYEDYFAQFEQAPEAYTLTDEDYALSSNENVARYKNFSDSNLPKDYLPEILNKKFAAENGYEMQVTYTFYRKVVEDRDNAKVLKSDNYKAMGQSYSNFSSEDVAEHAIAKFYSNTVPANDAGLQTTVKYVLFQNNAYRYIKVNEDYTTEVMEYKGANSYELTNEDYASVGSGKYNNFNDINDAESKVAQFAQESGKGAGNYTCKVYKNYFDKYVVLEYDGASWLKAQSTKAVTEPLNYNRIDPKDGDYKESHWWADPSIKITLGEEDYDSDDLTERYNNFDIRDTKPYADPAARAVALGAMLELNHQPIVEDQIYAVTYAYYDGSSGIATDRIIKQDGVWKQYSEE